MTSPSQAERRSRLPWLWAFTGGCNLFAAAMLYAADVAKGRPASTSAGLGLLLIGLSNLLEGWRRKASPPGQRLAIRAVQIVLALAGVVWLVICLSR